MTATTAPSPNTALTWLGDLRTIMAAKTYYEEALGWPVIFDVEPPQLLVTTGAVLDAITMPAGLAELVLVELRIEMLAGPVIVGSDSDWWTFLTAPSTTSGPAIPVELRGLRVDAVPLGTHVVLPSRSGNEGLPRWVERPRRRICLPPRPAVIGTARRVVARSGTVSVDQPALPQPEGVSVQRPGLADSVLSATGTVHQFDIADYHSL